MHSVRIALANLRIAETPDESVRLAGRAIADAGAGGAAIVCFPEAYVPGYRGFGRVLPAPDESWLEQAWQSIAQAASRTGVAVILGTERLIGDRPRISALVIDAGGHRMGFQDKVQLDPSEDATYEPGGDRRVFGLGSMTLGISICHEGWRYPETVRWAARRGAHVVFHPHLHVPEPGGFAPTAFGDPRNTFHEGAMLCRAAENGCYFASVNCATGAGSPTTSTVVRPDGTVLTYQPYGQQGLLFADLNLDLATGLLAARCKY